MSEMVRRIAAILLLGPGIDSNYEVAKAIAVAKSASYFLSKRRFFRASSCIHVATALLLGPR